MNYSIKILKNSNIIRYLAFKYREFRDKYSFTRGQNNVIRNKGISVSSKIQILGGNNEIKADTGVVLKDALLYIVGNNNRIILHSKAYLSGCELHIEDNNCLIEIGERTFIGHHSQLACTEDNSKILIGKDGMISSYVHIRTGDSHSILDVKDGHRINPASSVIIGEHCWIGEGVHILKGVTLESDVIVSTGAIVTKSFNSNLLIGGIPAKVIKEDVTWDKNRI